MPACACVSAAQAFLREGGFAVGPATVIRQAQVTALADGNGTPLLAMATTGQLWEQQERGHHMCCACTAALVMCRPLHVHRAPHLSNPTTPAPSVLADLVANASGLAR